MQPQADALAPEGPDPSGDNGELPEHLGLTVTRGPIPKPLPGSVTPGAIDITEDDVLVRFPTGARLLVSGGSRAILDLTDAEDDSGDPTWMVQGWAVTIAWLQRGHLSLHAAVVSICGATVAIAGDRGAGKSTTAMGLRARGHQLLVDDVGLVQCDARQARITPFARNVHLLPDAAAALDLDFDAMQPLAGGRTKAAFRPEDPPTDPLTLDRIVVLPPPGSVAGPPLLREVRGAARVSELVLHTARDGLAPRILGPERYFELLAQLADAVPLHVLRRSTSTWTLPSVMDLIEDLAAEGQRA